MNRQEVLSANRLRLHAFTGLALHVNNGKLYSLTSKGIINITLSVSDYMDAVAIRYMALPVGSCIVLVLDDVSAHSSEFTDTANCIRYDLTHIEDETIYTNSIRVLGIQRYIAGCICDANNERLAKVIIDLIFNGYIVYSEAGGIKRILGSYAYLAEPYLEVYSSDWLNRFTEVLDTSSEIKEQLRYSLRGITEVGFTFLRRLHLLLKDFKSSRYIYNLLTYSLFISDSKLFMVEQLRQFLTSYFTG